MKFSGKYKVSCCLVVLAWNFSNAFSQKPKESSDKDITICHLSNNYQTQSITIPYSALAGHLEHGDIIGECSSENSPLIISLNKLDVRCNGGSDGSIDLSIQFSKGNPPFSISWSNGSVTEDISNLRAGTYSVTVSISNGLSAVASISLIEPEPLTIGSRIKNISCSGRKDGEISVLPSGGNSPYKFGWSPNAGNPSGNFANNLSGGIYQVSVMDSKGCQATEEFSVEEPAPLTSSVSSKNILCYGGNDGFAAVIPDGGTLPYNFQWSSNAGNETSGIISDLSKGLYNCTVSDASGCQTFEEIIIEEPLPLNVKFSVTNESCSPGNNGSAIAMASGGTGSYSYQWDINANSQVQAVASGLSQGVYYMLVWDANGCMKTGEVNIGKEKCESMLRDEDCGATVVSLAQFIYCNPIDGATNYQWEFSNKQSGFIKTIQRGFGLTNFHLTWVPGIQYGKTYEVRIKPIVNGVWKDYGPYCQITVPAPIPYTKVRTADCGIITTLLSQQLFCDFVAGAQNYQWEFTNEEIGFQKVVNRGSNSLSFTLGWVTGIQYGKTYEVRVRASVGGEWGNFGDICQVSLVYPIPTTKVRFADCGIKLNSLGQNIFCDAVPGAMDYLWEISDPESGFITLFNRNSTNTNFQFGWISGIQYQTVYEIRVKAKVAGEWAEFGVVCQITTPNAPINPREGNFNNEVGSFENFEEHEHKLNVFPNPSKGELIRISLIGFENEENEFSVEVYDILGNKVFSQNSMVGGQKDLLAEINGNGELATGIYILNVRSKDKNYFDRIIVK